MTASSSVEGSMGAENPCKNAARQLQQLPPHIRRMCLGVCRVCFSFGRAHERTPAEQRMWGVRRGGSCILAFYYFVISYGLPKLVITKPLRLTISASIVTVYLLLALVMWALSAIEM